MQFSPLATAVVFIFAKTCNFSLTCTQDGKYEGKIIFNKTFCSLGSLPSPWYETGNYGRQIFPVFFSGFIRMGLITLGEYLFYPKTNRQC